MKISWKLQKSITNDSAGVLQSCKQDNRIKYCNVRGYSCSALFYEFYNARYVGYSWRKMSRYSCLWIREYQANVCLSEGSMIVTIIPYHRHLLIQQLKNLHYLYFLLRMGFTHYCDTFQDGPLLLAQGGDMIGKKLV